MAKVDDLLGKNLIIWNCIISQYDTKSFGYPKYILHNDGTMEYVDIDFFPDEGAIQFLYTGSTTVDEVDENYSEIFVISINNLQENYNYYDKSSNKYLARINLDFNDLGRGDVLLDTLSYFKIKQVIKTSLSLDIIREKRTILINDELYTKEIILECDSGYYGPFDTKKTDQHNEYKLEALPENSYQIGFFSHEVMNQYIAEIGDNNESLIATFVSNLGGDMLSKASEIIDFASTAVLKDNLNTLLSISRSSAPFIDEQLKDIKKYIIDSYNAKKAMFLTEYRLEKIIEMIDSAETVYSFDDTMIKSICENKNLRERIIEYTVLNRKEAIFENASVKKWADSRYNENIEKKELLSSDLCEAKDKEIISLKEKIKELESEVSKKDNYTPQIIKEELSDEIKRLQEEKELHQKRAKDAREDYNRWIKSKDEVEEELRDLIKEYADESKIIAKAANNRMMKDLMEIISGKEIEDKAYRFDSNIIKHYESGQQIIELLIDYLVDKAGRTFSYDEIVNFIICIANGFITTFAGQPGTGKTSICTLIAKALGLMNSESSRFVSVAVERGWSSSRDYIGYYNPLSKQFEKSNIEMFNAIQTMDYEARNNINEAPMFVLLDEANLSPIEHYWSGFNKLCDSGKYDDKSISLGGEYSWKIPNCLRFLATINYDHTTEELSSRFLDRSWMILMKTTTVDLMYDDENIRNAETIVAMSDIEKFFTPDTEDVLSEQIKGKLFNIQEAFRDNNLSISPRNIKMVIKYCVVAQKYMRNTMSPIDFSVAQKILPLINGAGKDYDNLIFSLEKEFEGSMPLSYEMIQRLKKNAENNFGMYQLF